MASVQIDTSLNNVNKNDIVIQNNFTLSATATVKGTLNLQNAASVTLPLTGTLINNVILSSTISSNGVPIGSIAIWYTSASIPSGWFQCDGTRTLNGVKIPDLRGRFVICADDDTYKVNTSAGSTTASITIENFPSHNHGTITTDKAGDHYHNLNASLSSDPDGDHITNRGGSENGGTVNYSVSGNHFHSNNPATANTGNNDISFNIMPSYHSLIYIIKLS